MDNNNIYILEMFIGGVEMLGWEREVEKSQDNTYRKAW